MMPATMERLPLANALKMVYTVGEGVGGHAEVTEGIQGPTVLLHIRQ